VKRLYWATYFPYGSRAVRVQTVRVYAFTSAADADRFVARYGEDHATRGGLQHLSRNRDLRRQEREEAAMRGREWLAEQGRLFDDN
jgi:hypothetical protein